MKTLKSNHLLILFFTLTGIILFQHAAYLGNQYFFPNHSTRFIQYIFSPLISLAVIFFISKNVFTNLSFHPNALVILSAFFYFLLLGSLKFFKLNALNYDFFDSGLYLNKIYTISHLSFWDGLSYTFSRGHFQPFLYFLSFIASYFYNPIFLFLFETMILATTIFPMYLIARLYLSPPVAALFSLSFLLSSTLQFIDFLGIHPDAFATFFIIWAMYFFLVRRYFLSIFFIVLLALLSETLIPTICAFCIYCFWRCRLPIFLILAVLSSIFFYYILFVLLPSFDSPVSGQLAFSERSIYGHIFKLDYLETFSILFSERKFFFFFFLFCPLLFLPIISCRVLLIALPEFCKLYFSSEPLHSAVDGHYTIVILPVLYFATLFSLHSFSQLNKSRCVYFLCFSVFSFNVAFSPLPFSIPFFHKPGSAFFIENFLCDQGCVAKKSAQEFIQKNISRDSSFAISNTAYMPILNNFSDLRLLRLDNYVSSDFILFNSNKYNGAGSAGFDERYQLELKKIFNEVSDAWYLVFSMNGVYIFSRQKVLS